MASSGVISCCAVMSVFACYRHRPTGASRCGPVGHTLRALGSYSIGRKRAELEVAPLKLLWRRLGIEKFGTD